MAQVLCFSQTRGLFARGCLYCSRRTGPTQTHPFQRKDYFENAALLAQTGVLDANGSAKRKRARWQTGVLNANGLVGKRESQNGNGSPKMETGVLKANGTAVAISFLKILFSFFLPLIFL